MEGIDDEPRCVNPWPGTFCENLSKCTWQVSLVQGLRKTTYLENSAIVVVPIKHGDRPLRALGRLEQHAPESPAPAVRLGHVGA